MRDVLIAGGIDADDVFASIDDGSALKQVRNEHKSVAESHHVWGVPTFIAGNRTVFVRLTVWNGRAATPDESIHTIRRTLDLLTDCPALNEFKHTSVPL